MSSRLIALFAGLAVLAASLPAHAISPQPEPPGKAKMRPLAPYFAGPQPDPPGKVRKIRVPDFGVGRFRAEPPPSP
jgi:hypothetical protein